VRVLQPGQCLGVAEGSGRGIVASVVPYRFAGGRIIRVAVDVSGDSYLDLEREAALMLMRE
jgi:hypothetical protein